MKNLLPGSGSKWALAFLIIVCIGGGVWSYRSQPELWEAYWFLFGLGIAGIALIIYKVATNRPGR